MRDVKKEKKKASLVLHTHTDCKTWLLIYSVRIRLFLDDLGKILDNEVEPFSGKSLITINCVILTSYVSIQVIKRSEAAYTNIK